MAAHLRDLGFALDDDDAVVDLLLAAMEAGATIPSSRGAYVCWAPGEGVELWVGLGPGGVATGLTPHFAGTSTLTLQAADLLRRPGAPLQGSLYAWTNPGAHMGTFEGPPLVVELPDLDLVADRLHCPAIVSAQVAAFPLAAECFADESAFRVWQEGHQQPGTLQCFIPSGAFAQPARAEAAFAGRIARARLRANPITGRPFHHLQVQTQIGAVDVVASPDSLDGLPVVGGIVQGYFWLSGRIRSLA